MIFDKTRDDQFSKVYRYCNRCSEHTGLLLRPSWNWKKCVDQWIFWQVRTTWTRIDAGIHNKPYVITESVERFKLWFSFSEDRHCYQSRAHNCLERICRMIKTRQQLEVSKCSNMSIDPGVAFSFSFLHSITSGTVLLGLHK
jgi:hypothetical protein